MIEKLTRRHIPVVENHPWPMEIFEATPKTQRPPRPPRDQRQSAPKGRAPAKDRPDPRPTIQQPRATEPVKTAPPPPKPARVIRTEPRIVPGRVVAFTDGRRSRRGGKSR